MLLLEHDAKTLLGRYGLAIPPGILVKAGDRVTDNRLPDGPWIVKAQAATGGRGKAGGIRTCEDRAQLESTVQELCSQLINGVPVQGCRIESKICTTRECYLSLSLNPITGLVDILVSPAGGVEIESSVSKGGALRRASALPDSTAIVTAGTPLLNALEADKQTLATVLERLADAFLELEALLVEINPLFILPDQSCLLGDAKVVLDANAFARQPHLERFLVDRAIDYPEAVLKHKHGFDFIVTDPQGTVGLLTTGAGLSMVLCDELHDRGLSPYNFCDIRTGGLRDDPQRLIDVLTWISDGINTKVILINVFGGITDLGVFARLLIQAMDRLPQPHLPVIARLIGPNQDEASALLQASSLQISLHRDLSPALDETRTRVRRTVS
jgi:succinyl-CoA synthetase beta subunit